MAVRAVRLNRLILWLTEPRTVQSAAKSQGCPPTVKTLCLPGHSEIIAICIVPI
jgi:prolyl-tRNA editing enzyme YbaK/EbsC (Cys-tRNA(Pro) deacylase)